jgi:hypothetical protein
MHIPGVSDPDDGRLAVDVARERGMRISLLQYRPGELWAAYALRMGISRRASARAWWELSQVIDEAYGLARATEPDWTLGSAVAPWDVAPWITPAAHQALLGGHPAEGPLTTHIGAWERVQPAVEVVTARQPAATSLDSLVARSEVVSPALAQILPPNETLAMQVHMQPVRAGVRPGTVAKYLRRGFQLAWENKSVILKTAGKKVGGKIIPIYNMVSTAQDVAQVIDYLLPEVEVTYLPKREYQLPSNSFVYRWPSGDITDAPPPG